MDAQKEIEKIIYSMTEDCGNGMIVDFYDIRKLIELLTEDKIEFAKYHVEQCKKAFLNSTPILPTEYGEKIDNVVLDYYPTKNIK